MKPVKKSPDFKALQLKIHADSKYSHTIYYKEHSVREHTKDRPEGRTLFIVNVPPYTDEKGLSNAFSKAGKVVSVQLSLKPNRPESTSKKFIKDESQCKFQVTYVVFEKVFELDKSLQLTELEPLNSKDHKIELGIKKWITDYNNSVLHPKALKENIEIFMKTYDIEKAKSEAKEKKLEQEDEDGWVTVTKKGKVQSFARTDKVENKILLKEERNKKRKELKNFYTFQIRESKMKHIVALRQKFEEDKKKIAQIKQSRRFKPF